MRLTVEAAVLVTSRLTLRPVEVDDAAAIAGVMMPAVTKWLASWPQPMTPAFARESRFYELLRPAE